jgi:hypothetical protein
MFVVEQSDAFDTAMESLPNPLSIETLVPTE